MPSRVAAEIAGRAMRCAAIALLSILAAGGATVAQQPAKPKAPAAASPQPAKPSAAGDGGKCIGVVSAIGDTFFLRKIGITVFGNGQSSVPVESWHIDDVVVSKISAFLSKGWTVRR